MPEHSLLPGPATAMMPGSATAMSVAIRDRPPAIFVPTADTMSIVSGSEYETSFTSATTSPGSLSESIVCVQIYTYSRYTHTYMSIRV